MRLGDIYLMDADDNRVSVMLRPSGQLLIVSPLGTLTPTDGTGLAFGACTHEHGANVLRRAGYELPGEPNLDPKNRCSANCSVCHA